VDFGGFAETVTRGKSDIELLFTLRDVTNKTGRARPLSFFENTGPIDITLPEVKVSLTLSLSAADATYASELKISFAKHELKIKLLPDYEVDSVFVDDDPLVWDKSKARIIARQGYILPTFFFAQKRKVDEPWVVGRNPWRNMLSDSILQHVHGNTSRGTIAKIASQIPLADADEISSLVKQIDGPVSWLAARNFISPESYTVNRFIRSLTTGNWETLVELIDDSLNKLIKGVRYLKPLRATAERHYRRVDLAVSEIDPEGRNLPIFLDSLPPHLLSDFRVWLAKYLGIDVEPQRQGAQIVLMAKGQNDDKPSNVADMGFGISQVLPIAAQLWAATSQFSRSEKTTFVVIEQPELHLHPAFQANLADLFAGVVKPASDTSPANREKPKIVIETHSQHIVYRLGALIENGTLLPSDVSIVLFEPSQENLGASTARTAHFDSDGILQNWPFGFFEPEM
jgi:hypothetical protein